MKRVQMQEQDQVQERGIIRLQNVKVLEVPNVRAAYNSMCTYTY